MYDHLDIDVDCNGWCIHRRANNIVRRFLFFTCMMLAFRPIHAEPTHCIRLSASELGRLPHVGATGAIIGHIGGVPMALRSAALAVMEFDDNLKVAASPSYRRPIRDFGLDTDLQMLPRLNNRESEAFHGTDSVSTKLRVRINANSNYYGPQSVTNLVNNYVVNLPFTYVREKERVFGLDLYRPAIAADGGNIVRPPNNQANKNIYTYRASSDQSATFISCSNSIFATASCQMQFTLEPKLPAVVSVSLNRKLLPAWMEIKQRVAASLTNFCVN
ncbi:hypothetical protein [Duganella sp. HH101]|uniref:hypothetical protein n=1 Tax=Duganella sp. HH101 TaxID=1781066 RepID=UPI0008937890|nr:hypothetical protein [Duganella sp. HH101]OFA00901.1 hypothetical protein DUGA2_46580 [Duganella sp. HH101]